MKVLQSGQWKTATPKGVKQGSVWKTPQKVHVLKGGQWIQVWPDAAPPAPPYLYDVQVEYLPNYEVRFTVLDGWEPTAGDYYFFACAEIPRDGPVGRVFSKTFVASAYNGLNCTLEDRSGIPGKEMKTISFKIYPKG